MKTKELKLKLSRLQSKAYNLQLDIQNLISDLEQKELKGQDKSILETPNKKQNYPDTKFNSKDKLNKLKSKEN